MPGARPQESGQGDECQRHGDLSAHQPSREPAGGDGGGLSAQGQRRSQADGFQGGQQAKQEPRAQRERRGPAGDDGVGAEIVASDSGPRPSIEGGREDAREAGGEDEAKRSAADGQEERFGHELPQEAKRRRPQRCADGQLARAAGAASEQQGAEVRAAQEQAQTRHEEQGWPFREGVGEAELAVRAVGPARAEGGEHQGTPLVRGLRPPPRRCQQRDLGLGVVERASVA